MYNVPHVDAK